MEEKIAALEYQRKELVRLSIIIIAISIIIPLFLLIIFRVVFSPVLFLAIVIGIMIGVLLSAITGYNKKLREYKTKFKTIFVEEPFRLAFHEVIYDKDQGFPKEIIKATGMMMLGNRYYTNDYVMGHYKDVKFERADIEIQQHTSNGKTSHTTTYFNGRWMIFEFNKDFHFDLQIIRNGFGFTQKNQTFFTDNDDRRHRLELEDVNFNQQFTVYAQDDHEAYYILTPRFMEVLKSLYHSMDGSFMLGFVRNQLHVAINTKRDAMEPYIFSSIDLYNIKQDVQREIDAIINIINGLDLDRDIYKN
jgi:hypothetical protein